MAVTVIGLPGTVVILLIAFRARVSVSGDELAYKWLGTTRARVDELTSAEKPVGRSGGAVGAMMATIELHRKSGKPVRVPAGAFDNGLSAVLSVLRARGVGGIEVVSKPGEPERCAVVGTKADAKAAGAASAG